MPQRNNPRPNPYRLLTEYIRSEQSLPFDLWIRAAALFARIWAYKKAFGQRLSWSIVLVLGIVALVDILAARFLLAGLEWQLFVVDVSVFDWLRNAYIVFATATGVYILAHWKITGGRLKPV